MQTHPPLFLQDRAKRLHDPPKGQRRGHDQVSGHEDRVAHVRGNPVRDVPAPWRRVDLVFLKDAIQADRQARQHHRRDHPLHLDAAAQVPNDRRKDHHVRKHRICALQSLVRAKQANPRADREQRGQQVNDGQHRHRPQQGRVQQELGPGSALFQRFPACPAFFDQLDEPGAQDDQRQRAQEGELVGFKNAAGVDIEKDWHNDDRRQPGGFHNAFTVTTQFGGHIQVYLAFFSGLCGMIRLAVPARSRQGRKAAKS